MIMDYEEIIKNGFYVDPVSTSYGTIPKYVEEYLSKSKIEVKPYEGVRPNWIGGAAEMRDNLMREYWGGEYMSRSLQWVIGHNGTPLSEDSIQIDHIVKWDEISEKLLYQYNGKNAKGTQFQQLITLPHIDGKLIKGIDFIDDPDVINVFGPDVLYRFTNIAAIKYFHTIENLRPLPGSINSRRNNTNLDDEDLGIIPPKDIDFELMNKLAELSASIEEYTTQVVQNFKLLENSSERTIYREQFKNKTEEIISHLRDVNRTEFE